MTGVLSRLADSFHSVLGDRPSSTAETLLSRTVVKWIALHTSMPWPQGVPTRPEVDPKRDGTKPVDFDRDRGAVVDRGPSPAAVRPLTTPARKGALP
jgi:hypothetical protein